jgi:hypothetical protein
MFSESKYVQPSLPPVFSWTASGRALVFFLAATSIWCLLAEFYGLCSMRTFTMAILLPASALLIIIALLDRSRGDGRLWRAVVVGAVAGLSAAVAYDVFRLPFVFARQWHLAGVVPPMNLFKVFPRFGAMILGQPIEQPRYSGAAQWIGWAYHFSNGLTFGVMYMALIGEGRNRSWGWAVAMAVGLELGMLLTPYPKFFGIHVTVGFVIVTLVAHGIFGVMMGLMVRALSSGTGSVK